MYGAGPPNGGRNNRPERNAAGIALALLLYRKLREMVRLILVTQT